MSTTDESMDESITRYTWLVRTIAKHYPLPAGWERKDVEQWGDIGLWNALKRYDPEGLHKGYRFETVASFAIKLEIRKALRQATGMDIPAVDIAEQPTTHLPIIALKPLTPPAWMQDRITQELEALPSHEPSVEEQVMTAVDGAQLSATLEAALLLLPERQRVIIERRFGLSGDNIPWSQSEIGRFLGVTQQAVSKAQHKALVTLRRHLSSSRDGELVLIQLDTKQRSRRAMRRVAA